MEERSLGLTVFEWIEYVWYAKIVEFDVSDQQRLAAIATSGLKAAGTAAKSYVLATVGVVAGVCALVLVLSRFRRGTGPAGTDPEEEQRAATEAARHFYGRMLRVLSRQDLRRKHGQTPYEFLRHVEEPALGAVSVALLPVPAEAYPAAVVSAQLFVCSFPPATVTLHRLSS